MRLYLKTKDYAVSEEEFQLLRDDKLKMLVTEPKPEDVSKYYQSENYISHSDSKKSLVDKIYQWVKIYSINQKVNLITKYSVSGNTLLDFGAGTGDFLVRAKKRGWQVFGAEPNDAARMRAQKKGIALFNGMDAIPNNTYDVITLWHVLEHLPDLQTHIKKLTSLLNAQGTLIVAVPNYRSYDAKYYKKHWAAYDVPRHLWHFSQDAIAALFHEHGLKVIKTKPMIFDAFYVSLLSEKYKTGKQNFLSAFCIGLWSNMKAWQSKEYSSLIYMLKKG